MNALALASDLGQSRRSVLLLSVIAAHAAALWLVVRGMPEAPVTPAEPLPIMVSLITPQAPAPVKPAPEPIPKPEPVLRAKTPTPPTPAPKPAPTPVPQAVPQQVQASPAPAPAQQPAAPSELKPAPAVAAPPAPPVVTPARFDAAYLNNPAPAYPPLSRRLGEQGKVYLRVLVSPDGLAETVELKTGSGSARLDQAAQDTVRKWRFIPAKQGDKPVSAWVVVPIVFKLEE